MEQKQYTIHLDVNVHGWEEGVDVHIEADSQWEAVDRLGAVLSELCASYKLEKDKL